jgi:hypothetical protein
MRRKGAPPTSPYVGVCLNNKASNGLWGDFNKPWQASIHYKQDGETRMLRKYFEDERSAAIQYDKWVLELRLNRPLNILKPKTL